jgi:glucose-6-phosphate 1-dehydrogenase
MATAVEPRSTEALRSGAGPAVADVFVVFGITGDPARVMRFHSVYRLEKRGLLSCPIVGVAVSDWSADDLRE